MDKRIPREEFFYASWGGFGFLLKEPRLPAEGATASCPWSHRCHADGKTLHT
ncbi:hypothetical protein [Parabacteroides sp. An277]|uniref:hypothetical protein n=1 Tax=Parabacteroides sp. An277 TaxID=1965619 RepID=UPI0013A62F95|nr:hypothetical protein [Parabacteroides sp. An277]